jgi:endonuclease
MSVYPRPAKSLMVDWAKEHLSLGQTFKKSAVVQWFAEHYGKIKRNTVNMHIDGMSVNNPTRRFHPNIKPGSGHDLFYKLGPDQFRLWDPASDPPPRYKEDFEKEVPGVNVTTEGELEDEPVAEATREFAFERDLRNYLVKNLGLIEAGLRLYDDEEGNTGIEFPVWRTVHRHSRHRQRRPLRRHRAESLARI